MTTASIRTLLSIGCALMGVSAAAAEGAATQPAVGAEAVAIVIAADVAWMPGPAAFPKGLELSVLQGDPSKEGPFVVRLRAPAGYRIPAHVHGGAEHVTIVSGDLRVGTGTSFDASALRALAPGDFVSIPANVPHFAMTEGGMVMQVHGNGPLTITCCDGEHPAPTPKQ